VCSEAVPDSAVVTRLCMDWIVQVSSLSRGTRLFLLPKDSDQFWCLSTLLFSEYRQLFPGIRLPGHEAKHSPLLSGLYCAMCLHGRSGTTSRCFTKVPYKAIQSAVPRLSAGRQSWKWQRELHFQVAWPHGKSPGICYKQENFMWIVEKRELWIVANCLWWTWKCLRC
jgi:hypothetical protein